MAGVMGGVRRRGPVTTAGLNGVRTLALDGQAATRCRGTWPRSQVAAAPPARGRSAGLATFISRLHWRCHFIQKLESEPALEYANLHRGYDGLRKEDWNPENFAALVSGCTGWPLADACVAMLGETGWINFRMPAELRTRHGLGESDLAMPPVDLEAATRAAKERLFALRARPEIKSAKAAIVARHGSRKRGIPACSQAAVQVRQLSLEF